MQEGALHQPPSNATYIHYNTIHTQHRVGVVALFGPGMFGLCVVILVITK